MERIPASERTREQLKALMEGKVEALESNSDLVRLAARLIIEEALEGEAEDEACPVVPANQLVDSGLGAGLAG